MSEGITVEGLQKEKRELKNSYQSARAAFEKAKTTYEKAKEKFVEFNNSYGRVLEVLDASDQE